MPGSPVNGRPAARRRPRRACRRSRRRRSAGPEAPPRRTADRTRASTASSSPPLPPSSPRPGRHGHRLSQKALGDRLRQDGHRVANDSLHALVAAASDLAADTAAPHSGECAAGEPAATALQPGRALAAWLPSRMDAPRPPGAAPGGEPVMAPARTRPRQRPGRGAPGQAQRAPRPPAARTPLALRDPRPTGPGACAPQR